MAVSKVQCKLELAVSAVVVIDEVLNLLLACRPYCGLESVVLPSIVSSINCNRSNNCITLLRRNELDINKALLENIVTVNKDIPDDKKEDLLISLITLKYTQSNSVCYVKDGQCIGIGAGQQSRIHCTRLAGNKADIWWLRQHPKVMGLQFVDDISRPVRDNTIDVYISEEHDDVLRDGVWQTLFKVKPEVLTMEEKKEWIAKNTDVSIGSDAFFPFGDNIERAYKSGVKYIAEPGGSIRDDNVIETCDKYGMAMAFTGIRLFHH